MRLRYLAIALMCASSFAAHADTIQNFNASGTFADGASLSGTITINTTAGTVIGSNIEVGAPDSLTFSVVKAQVQGYYGAGEYSVNLNDVGITDFLFGLVETNGSSLVGYRGGALVSANLYNLATSTPYNPGNGVLSSVTPEPYSFVLLATGLLGVAGEVKRRALP